MDPSLQHHYLQTLGILQYIPKDSVVDQAVHVNADIGVHSDPSIDASVLSPGTAVTQIDKKSVDVAALLNLNFDKPDVSSRYVKSSGAGISGTKSSDAISPVIAKTASKKTPVVENIQSEKVLEVRFSLWQVSDEILVCSTVEGALADTTEMHLLTNILNAIGCGIGRLPQIELVEWPPYPNASGDEAEVRDFLATLFDARLANKPVKSVLLLGDSAANWLLSHEQRDQNNASGQVNLSPQTTALLLPSLSSMIENPQRKATAWRVVKFLLPAAITS